MHYTPVSVQSGDDRSNLLSVIISIHLFLEKGEHAIWTANMRERFVVPYAELCIWTANLEQLMDFLMPCFR